MKLQPNNTDSVIHFQQFLPATQLQFLEPVLRKLSKLAHDNRMGILTLDIVVMICCIILGLKIQMVIAEVGHPLVVVSGRSWFSSIISWSGTTGDGSSQSSSASGTMGMSFCWNRIFGYPGLSKCSRYSLLSSSKLTGTIPNVILAVVESTSFTDALTHNFLMPKPHVQE